MMMRMITAADG